MQSRITVVALFCAALVICGAGVAQPRYTTTTQQAADAAQRQHDTGSLNQSEAQQLQELERQQATPTPTPSPTSDD